MLGSPPVPQDLDKYRNEHAQNLLDIRKKCRKEMVSTIVNEILILDDYFHGISKRWGSSHRESKVLVNVVKGEIRATENANRQSGILKAEGGMAI